MCAIQYYVFIINVKLNCATKPFQADIETAAWNGDYALSVYNNTIRLWSVRGSQSIDGLLPGTFASNANTGGASTFASFRLTPTLY